MLTSPAGVLCCCWPLSAAHRGFRYPGSWRVRGCQRPARLLAVTDPGAFGDLRNEKPKWVQACRRSPYHHTESWGVCVGCVCVCHGVQKSCRWASRVMHLDHSVLRETVEAVAGERSAGLSRQMGEMIPGKSTRRVVHLGVPVRAPGHIGQGKSKAGLHVLWSPECSLAVLPYLSLRLTHGR